MTALEPVLPSVTEPPADGSDDSLEAQVDALATRLEATAELPIDRETNRWLGEAEAIVATESHCTHPRDTTAQNRQICRFWAVSLRGCVNRFSCYYIARDAAMGDLEPETIRTRVRQVQRLLSEADEPEHEAAADHLEAARERCRDVLGE